RLRQHRAALDRERALPQAEIESLASTRSSGGSESFQADEFWRQMLEVCPPAHYELLELKRQGASLAEIAARTHLHQSSVRRILYDIARRIGIRQAAGTR